MYPQNEPETQALPCCRRLIGIAGLTGTLPHCNAGNVAKEASFLICINADLRVGDATVTIPKNSHSRSGEPERAKEGRHGYEVCQMW
jgi:hypothetical protein